MQDSSVTSRIATDESLVLADSSDSDISKDVCNPDDDDDWKDVEPDTDDEAVFISFFDDKEFSSLEAMLDYIKHEFSFDFLSICRHLRRSHSFSTKFCLNL